MKSMTQWFESIWNRRPKKRAPIALAVANCPEEVAILKTSASKDKHIVYIDAAGEWRWKRLAPNNKIVATSGEGYKNRSFCIQMVRRMCEGADEKLIFFEEANYE